MHRPQQQELGVSGHEVIQDRVEISSEARAAFADAILDVGGEK